MKRLAFSILAFCSAWVALIAYIFGVIRIGEWTWGGILRAQQTRWYGIQDIPVLSEVLAFFFLAALMTVGIYFVLVLPIFLMGYVYEGLKSLGSTQKFALGRETDEPR